MIFGIVGPSSERAHERRRCVHKSLSGSNRNNDVGIFSDSHVAIGLKPAGVPTLDIGSGIFVDDDSGIAAVLFGCILNGDRLLEEFGVTATRERGASPGSPIVLGYRNAGENIFAQLNGNFLLALWDKPNHRFYLVRDHLGVEMLYFSFANEQLYFSNDPHVLSCVPEIGREMNVAVLYRYLLFNYNFGRDSFFKNIQVLPPGHFVKIEDGHLTKKRYWHLSFSDLFEKKEAEYREELLSLISDAVRLRIPAGDYKPGAFLSGGMDSSTVVSLMSTMVRQPVSTFSFRCMGKTFDESHYARIMSEHYETLHYEVPFHEEETTKLANLVQASPEPFSDIGIEVASFLLGSVAQGKADYILTGDGGDELFGGHPVYLADRAARYFDNVPSFIRNPLTKGLQQLPDTDKKKTFMVKAKRFSYSCKFPREIYSNRWRIYYTDAELRRLCRADLLASLNEFNPFEEVREIYSEADGKDFLSKALYGDYATVVGFYLRRMSLVRKFGIEGRLPLLDHRLVEYAARIPSDLKINRNNETKYLMHRVMQGVLPDEIVFRKDKLGHSVPMKNWMREDGTVQKMLHEYLAPETIRKRGFFNPDYVAKLMAEHRRKSENHSHRLWALLVLEMWLQAHFDNRV